MTQSIVEQTTSPIKCLSTELRSPAIRKGAVNGNKVQIWNNDWISSKRLLTALDPANIVDKQMLKSLKPVIKPSEIRVFAYERY
jgi:hypothetical protein